ncbi:hypothetical protein JTE90_020363 [Oedothorax gibbosus]|uniref:Uncharacterized protein n=1 Tax=Oedothorax gibbosus TaxID=931172 RepID=A0AAV6TWZ4_9ARAC|nr:hypothetical protein JTE90_020363 [Oedothorax gibbosus]
MNLRCSLITLRFPLKITNSSQEHSGIALHVNNGKQKRVIHNEIWNNSGKCHTLQPYHDSCRCSCLAALFINFHNCFVKHIRKYKSWLQLIPPRSAALKADLMPRSFKVPTRDFEYSILNFGRDTFTLIGLISFRSSLRNFVVSFFSSAPGHP